MKSVIDLIDPLEIEVLSNHSRLGGGWSYVLDYSWIYNNIVEYSKEKRVENILDVGCGKSRFGGYVSNKLNTRVIGIDRRNLPNVTQVENFLYYNSDIKFDVIFWASSLEHNGVDMMEKLYIYSLSLLKHNGLFLATIPISYVNSWNEISNHTNLGVETSRSLFDIYEVKNELFPIARKYLENPYGILDKYEKRYGTRELEYIIGGIRKVK